MTCSSFQQQSRKPRSARLSKRNKVLSTHHMEGITGSNCPHADSVINRINKECWTIYGKRMWPEVNIFDGPHVRHKICVVPTGRGPEIRARRDSVFSRRTFWPGRAGAATSCCCGDYCINLRIERNDILEKNLKHFISVRDDLRQITFLNRRVEAIRL